MPVLPTYLRSRAIALGFPLALICGILVWSGSETDYRTFLLCMIVVTGYVHFIVGAIYQFKAIRRAQNQKLLRWFLGILIVTGILSGLMVALGQTILLGLINIIYFTFHIFLNETSALERSFKRAFSYPLMLSFVALVLPLFAVSLSHRAFFFDYSLWYPVVNPDWYQHVIKMYLKPELMEQGSVLLLVLFAITVPYYAYHRYKNNWLSLILLALAALELTYIVFMPQPNFVYILHMVLVSHFVLFSVMYLPDRQQYPDRFNDYVRTHAYVLVPLLAAAVCFFLIPGNPTSAIFRFDFFIVASIMHISASFLNEAWFKKMIGI